MNAASPEDSQALVQLVHGWWLSRLIYAGTTLDVFEALPRDGALTSAEVALAIGAEPAATYRLMRALASIGVLFEEDGRRFTLTPMGALLRADAVPSLRDIVLLEASPVHAAFWNHLDDVVREGTPNGVVREYGFDYWQLLQRSPEHHTVFNAAMASYSRLEAASVLQLLSDLGATIPRTICDVGGGYGDLAAALLRAWPKATAIVLDLPNVVDVARNTRGEGAGSDRLTFVGGDAMLAVPTADAYFFKHVLHDFNDDEVLRMLASVRRAAQRGARVYICAFVVPVPQTAHFAKLFDMHMLVVSTGCERTELEYRKLLEGAGFVFDRVRTAMPLSIVEAHVA